MSDYPLVEQYLHHAPWFGRGGWTYFPDNALDILDNQFLKTAIELGLVGVVALTAFFLVPTISALIARRQSSDPELRLLCAALAGAALAATACSFTFDSLSYPMFTGLYALVIGLIGAAWQLAAAEAPERARSSTEVRPDKQNTATGGRLTVDLLLILRKLWRHRFITLPIIALTLFGAFYVIAVKAPVYKVSSSYVLINPPPPPTADDIARNPALGRINPNNPYTRFSDQSVIVSLLSSSLSADTARQQLVNQGADPRYTVSPGSAARLLEPRRSGRRAWAPPRRPPCTPPSWWAPARLRSSTACRRLRASIPSYRIRTQQVVAPNSPTQQLSSTLRPLVGCPRDRRDFPAAGRLGGRGPGHPTSRVERARPVRGDNKRDSLEGTAASNGRHESEDLPRRTGSAMRQGEARNGSTPKAATPPAGRHRESVQQSVSAGELRPSPRAKSTDA